jgi:putative spermidine/putrescine transport system permease protein
MSAVLKKGMALGSRLLVKLAVVVAVVFMAGPALFIAVISFSEDSVLKLPVTSWGTGRYTEVFTSGNWGDPLLLSVQVASLTALGALILVVPAVFAIKRSRLPGRDLVEGAAIAPLLFPISAFAVGLYGVFAQLDLLGTFEGIVMAHVIHGVPMVMIIMAAAFDQVRPELELAAMTMGASRFRAWVSITLRLLAPSIAAAAVFGFVSSFDEAVLISFLGGTGLTTLPKYIFDSVQFGVDPSITAIATLLMLATAGLMLVATAFRKKEAP